MSRPRICDNCGLEVGALGIAAHLEREIGTWADPPDSLLDFCGFRCMAAWAEERAEESSEPHRTERVETRGRV